jgi:energy-coupling factor transporter ATP-binding protein EcfA2
MKPGPITTEQLTRFGRVWNQGEHVLINGPTGSGKTALARHVIQKRIDRGGHVIVFVSKPREDKTISEDYSEKDGWVRWKRWKKTPGSWENKVLLWPDVSKLSGKPMIAYQQSIFQEALDALGKEGKWCVLIDDALYFCNPRQLNFGNDVAIAHAMGRSSNLSIVTNIQRPAHVPLIIYSSAAHAFVGRMRELADYKRLAELGGQESTKELSMRISKQGRHDFLWIPVAPDWPSEAVNLAR